MDLPKLFWPIPRDLITSEERNRKEIHRVRSLVTYQLLFGGRLVIRDSDYLNSLALRESVTRTLEGRADDHATFFRALLDEGYILIARRKENSLVEVAEQLLAGGKSAIIPDSWYAPDFPDIEYIESGGAVYDDATSYAVSDAASYYTNELKRILSGSLEPHLPDDFRVRVAEQVELRLQTQQTLGWNFLTLTGEIWKAFSDSDRQKYGDFLYRVVGQAPHTGFIPHALDMNPIYMNDVAEAIDLWRGRHRQPRDVVKKRTFKLGEGFSLSDYVDCLARLPLDTIQNLVRRDESVEFRKKCKALSYQKAELQDVGNAYCDYRKVINAEIMKQGFARRTSGIEADIRTLGSSAAKAAGSEAVEIIVEDLFGSAIPFWNLGLKVTHRAVIGEWPTQRKIRKSKEKMADDLAADLEDLQAKNDRLSAEVIAGADGALDRKFQIDWPESGDVCVSDSR